LGDLVVGEWVSAMASDYSGERYFKESADELARASAAT
jgi:hypothetical protein